jgi:glycosyltransferase involved in cell wall biosynthesis
MGSTIKKKCVVVSAINFSEGGPLTVFQDCLTAAVALLPPDWNIIALVHNKLSFNQSRVQFIDFPKAKHSWLLRMSYEWILFFKLSKTLKPDLWLSLHDITPLVKVRRQAVYCHNPTPFYSMTWQEVKMSPILWVFTVLYKYLYRLFIKRNSHVIVQQEWLRDAFIKMYGKLPLVVAYPSLNITGTELQKKEIGNKHLFLYPSFPRVFKNFEVICEAAEILERRNVLNFEVRLTIDGSENAYSKWVFLKYDHVKNLNFIGLQSKINLAKQYEASSVVIFPSKLETWGLPISEAKLHKKALILADLPYAHETVGCYDKVSYFPATNATVLADIMQAIIENKWLPTGSKHHEPKQPFARNWGELWLVLIKDL